MLAPVISAAVHGGHKSRRFKRSFVIGAELKQLWAHEQCKATRGSRETAVTKSDVQRGNAGTGRNTDISTSFASSTHNRYTCCFPLMVATAVNKPACRCCRPHDTHSRISSSILFVEQCSCGPGAKSLF